MVVPMTNTEGPYPDGPRSHGMRRSPLTVVFAILVGATLFVGGMLAERWVVSRDHQLAAGTQGSQSNGRSDKVGIRGQGNIVAYHSDGTRFAVWDGHNSLNVGTVSNLADCITGAGAPFAQPCSGGWVTGIFVQGTNPSGYATAPATNSLTPAGCGSSSTWCTGWTSTATIDSTITPAFNISVAGAGCGSGYGGPSSTTCNSGFDTISIPTAQAISVQPGDRVIVTITFTVS